MAYTKKALKELPEAEVVSIAVDEFGLDASIDDIKDETIERIYAEQKARKQSSEPVVEVEHEERTVVITAHHFKHKRSMFYRDDIKRLPIEEADALVADKKACYV